MCAFTPDLRGYVSVGKGSKTPTQAGSYAPGADERFNFGLEPATSMQYETGLKYRLSEHAAGRRRLPDPDRKRNSRGPCDGRAEPAIAMPGEPFGVASRPACSRLERPVAATVVYTPHRRALCRKRQPGHRTWQPPACQVCPRTANTARC